jgi:hypothetical protein
LIPAELVKHPNQAKETERGEKTTMDAGVHYRLLRPVFSNVVINNITAATTSASENMKTKA